jgi:hypothetical protein
MRMRIALAPLLATALIVAPASSAAAPSPASSPTPAPKVVAADRAWIRLHAQAPVDYLIAKLATHRVVAIGETHWVHHEVGLIRSIVPRLVDAGATTLAVEVFPAATQSVIDSLLAGGEWRADLAMRVLRAGDWPYRDYLLLLQDVWRSNHDRTDGRALRILALGPGPDWRAELVPKGENYESFMAKLVLARLREDRGRLLLYTGLHHAFTRYRPTETTEDDRTALRGVTRTGNLLWDALGDRIALVMSVRQLRCRSDGGATYALPLAGRIDAAALAAKAAPFAFDTDGSPWGDLVLDSRIVYAVGHPRLRPVDLADGWVWFGPQSEYAVTELIPIAEYAPDEASLREVCARNPFDDRRDLTRSGLDSLWVKQEQRRRSASTWFGW